MISTELSRNQYEGNGSTESFAYAFHIKAAADLLVVHTDTDAVETTLVLDTDYTIAGAGLAAGGTVAFPESGSAFSTLASSEYLTIIRRPDLLQLLDITNQGGWYPETIEEALDDIVKLCQSLQEQIDRTYRVADSALSNPASLALFTDLWNGVSLFLNKTLFPTNSMTADASTGDFVFYIAGVEAFRITATGIVGKFNVKSYGAVGDGVTDDTVAIQAAIDAVTTGLTGETYPSSPGVGNRILGGDTLVFPAGTYLVTELTTKSCIKFKGVGSAASVIRVTGVSSVGITSEKTAGVFAVSRIMFEDIRIESNGDATQTGVLLVDADDCGMKNVTITGFGSYGLHLQKAQYCNFINVTIDDCGTGVYLNVGGGAFGCNNNTFDRLGIYGCATGFDIVEGVANWLYAATIQNCSVVGLNIQASSNNFNVIGGHFEFQNTVFDIVNAGRNTTLQDVFFVVNAADDTSRKVQNTGTGVMRFISCATQGAEPVTVGASRAIIETTTGLCDIIGCKFGSSLTGAEYVSDNTGANAAVKGYSLVRDIVFSAARSNHELRQEMHATADKGMSTKIIGDATPRFWVDGSGAIFQDNMDAASINQIDQTPTVPLGAGNTWRGWNIDAGALDPAGVGAIIYGGFIDLSDIDMTNEPLIAGIHIEMPASYTGQAIMHPFGASGNGMIFEILDNDKGGHGIFLSGGDQFVSLAPPSTAFALFGLYEGLIDASSLVASSEVHIFDAIAVGNGSANIVALGVNPGIAPIHQHVGAFVTPDQAEYAARFPDGGAWTDEVDGHPVVPGNGDIIYIGSATMFDSLEVLLSTPSGKDIFQTHQYLNGSAAWITFTPTDTTNGFQNNGQIEWDSGNFVDWDAVGDPGGADGSAGYWIRITRTRVSSLSPDPIVTTIKTLAATEFGWDKEGNLSVNSIIAASDNILQVPLEYATIQAAVDAASVGDTILVQPGTYNEAVVIDVNNLTLKGYGPSTLIDGGTTGVAVLVTGATGVTLIDFAVQTTAGAGNNYHCIQASDACDNLRIIRVTVNASDSDGINISSSGGYHIYGCTVADTDRYTLYLNSPGTDGVVTNNVLGASTTSAHGVSIEGDKIAFTNNVVGTGSSRAVNLTAASSRVIVDGNVVNGASIVDSGTNNLVGDNI